MATFEIDDQIQEVMEVYEEKLRDKWIDLIQELKL